MSYACIYESAALAGRRIIFAPVYSFGRVGGEMPAACLHFDKYYPVAFYCYYVYFVVSRTPVASVDGVSFSYKMVVGHLFAPSPGDVMAGHVSAACHRWHQASTATRRAPGAGVPTLCPLRYPMWIFCQDFLCGFYLKAFVLKEVMDHLYPFYVARGIVACTPAVALRGY